MNFGLDRLLSDDALRAQLKGRRVALLAQGISSNRVVSRGYGKANPVGSNDTAAGRQMNRRVEIVLSDDNGQLSAR